MKQCSKCLETKPYSEFSPKESSKDGYRGQCKDCRAKYSQSYRKENKDSVNASNRRYEAEHREQCNAYKTKYNKNNPQKLAAREAQRRADKLLRTPKWLTPDQKYHIQTFYDNAQSLTKQLGVKFEVDHIMPLKGKLASGLHVPWNLQILTKKDNQAKGNRLCA